MSEPSPSENHPEFTGVHAATWMFVALVAMVPACLLLLLVRPNLFEDAVSLAAMSAIVYLGVSALLLGRYPAGDSLSPSLGLRSTQPLLPLLGLLIGVCAQFPADRLRLCVEHFFPVPPGEAEAMARLLEPTSKLHAGALVFSLALLVPFTEEAFFRGAVFGALRRSGRSATRAAFITGLGFTLSHTYVRHWLPIGFAAALLGFVRAGSGSLWPGVMMHIGFNGLAIAASVLGSEQIEAASVPLWVELGMTGLLIVLCVVFGLVCRGAAASRARSADEVFGG